MLSLTAQCIGCRRRHSNHTFALVMLSASLLFFIGFPKFDVPMRGVGPQYALILRLHSTSRDLPLWSAGFTGSIHCSWCAKMSILPQCSLSSLGLSCFLSGRCCQAACQESWVKSWFHSRGIALVSTAQLDTFPPCCGKEILSSQQMARNPETLI